MKAKESLFLLLSGITAFTVLMTGCVKQPDYSGPDDNGQGGGNGFDYATVADVKINVDYSMKGNKAVFEVFAENPVIEKDGLLVRKEGVKSLLKAYTDRDSRYSGVVNLPTATDRVWLYSESYGLPTCVETQVTASGISFNLDSFLENLASQRKDRTAAAAQASLTRGGSTPDNILNVQTPLGGYDIDGKPDYLEKNAATVPDGLMNRVQNVLLPGNEQLAVCPSRREGQYRDNAGGLPEAGVRSPNFRSGPTPSATITTKRGMPLRPCRELPRPAQVRRASQLFDVQRQLRVSGLYTSFETRHAGEAEIFRPGRPAFG